MSLEFTISSILDDAGIPYKTNSRSFVMDCPRCGKKDKLYLDKEEGFWICWVCSESDGFKGSNPAYVLHVLTGRPPKEIKRILYGLDTSYRNLSGLPDELNFEDLAPEPEKPLVPFVMSPEMVPVDAPDAIPGLEYLRSRGIPAPIAKLYQLRYWARFRRIIFPLIADGICYGYQARMIDQVKPGEIKILSSRDLPRRNMVMFYDRLKGRDHAVVCEGPFDALKAHCCGGNVATLGKHITPQQIELLKKAGIKKIYFALDNDTLSIVPDLARECNLEAYLLRTPPGREDLGDSTPQEVLNEFKKAQRVTGNDLFFDIPKKR